MAKLITVLGATGVQGGSVVASCLKSGDYKVRGVTRNVESAASKALIAKGVEMVKADVNDEASLVKAFEGSHAIYALTDFFALFPAKDAEEACEAEAVQGINLAKAAAKTPTLQHYIWSTLPDSVTISGGKYSVPHFQGKVKVDQFIKNHKALLSKTTFLWVTYYASNITFPPVTPNFLKTSGKYVQMLPVSKSMPIISMGDTKINAGIYVLAILSQPQLTLPGKYVVTDTEPTTAGELLEIWSKAAGKQVEYVRVSLEEYDAIWPKWGMELGIMFQFWDDVRERSWSSDERILTKKDLKVEGLVSTEDAFISMGWSGFD